MNLSQPSAELIIILHEIYGVNEHIQSVRRRFSAAGFETLCPYLLPAGMIYPYNEAAQAHQFFMQQVGFERAAEQVIQLGKRYRPHYQKLFLAGFSIGATTAWLCSESGLFDGIAGYYGSRIRDYTDIQPACPALLLFPCHEASFPVDSLIKTLSCKTNVQVSKVNALHGFADPWSEHYRQECAEAAFAQVLAFFHRLLRKTATRS